MTNLAAVLLIALAPAPLPRENFPDFPPGIRMIGDNPGTRMRYKFDGDGSYSYWWEDESPFPQTASKGEWYFIKHNQTLYLNDIAYRVRPAKYGGGIALTPTR